MVAPKGINASFASLKCCLPKGMPIIVIQNKIPQNKWDNISRNPPQTIQIILRMNRPAPPPYTTCLPKGHNASPASLKACSPMGMPIIVIQQITPAITQPRAIIKPPNINQIKLPIIRIKQSPH